MAKNDDDVELGRLFRRAVVEERISGSGSEKIAKIFVAFLLIVGCIVAVLFMAGVL